MKDKLIYIVPILLFLAPYKTFNQDRTNILVAAILSIIFLFLLKEVKVEKKYLIMLAFLCAAGLISLFGTEFSILSVQGFSVYIAAIICYMLFYSYKDKEENIIKISTYGLFVLAVFILFIQGALYDGGVQKGRIDGNIGYANTYALLMIIGIYFNNIRKSDLLKETIDIICMLSIFYTGSRNSLLYLGVFLIVKIADKYKREKILDLKCIMNLFIAVGMYIAVEKLGMVSLLLIPLVLIIYSFAFGEKSRKVLNIISIMLIPLSIIVVAITQSNLLKRLKEVSLSSVELQQRFGYWEDAIKYVFNNPFGGGINTYMYKQGSFQTAYYDVRYVHNVFIQFLYDLGLPGLLCIIALFAAGIYLISRGKSKHRAIYMFLYITIYCHSLLDFNFAYAFTLCALSMIVSLAQNDEMCEIKTKKHKNTQEEQQVFYKPVLLTIIPILIIFYFSFLTIMLSACETNINKGNLDSAISKADFIDKISFKDNSAVLDKSVCYRKKYHNTSDKNNLYKAISTLEKNLRNKDNHLGVLQLLARCYMDTNQYDKLHKTLMEYFSLNKYDYNTYKLYYDYLKTSKSRGNDKAEQSMKEVNDYYMKYRNSMTEERIKYFGQSVVLK